MTTCREPGCKRQPAYPDQSYCREHRLRFVPVKEPAWRRWTREHQNYKDYTAA